MWAEDQPAQKSRRKRYDACDDVVLSFAHYRKHKKLFILLYKQGLAHLSLQSIKDACGPKPEQSNIVAYATA